VSRVGSVALVLGALLLLLFSSASCERKQARTALPEETGVQGAGSASAAQTAERSSTGIPDVGTLIDPTPPPQIYVVQAGDTLCGIAQRFGLSIDALIEANQIVDPNTLRVGQELQVPASQFDTGPSLRLLPNSEFVNSPAYVDFDVSAFCARQGGYLSTYQENVGGHVLSGPEIVERIAHHYSVGPRLLLAVLELKSGWVTDPNPVGDALNYPLGYRGSGWNSLHYQLAWAADKLNQGYYDWRGRGMPIQMWGDGTSTRYAPSLNAATAGLQYFFALDASRSEWLTLVGDGPGSFVATYRQLFGDPAQYAIEPLIPLDVSQPTLSLPWSQGEMWFYTGGPHGGWNDGSAWAAIDVVPDEGYLGCQPAASWATAPAAGLVIYSQEGEVMVDLDGDGHEQTGWVLFYLHVASEGRVPVGAQVRAGDYIGHPSCEGGYSESTHLHFARRYNGEWIAADGPLPLVLSGWQFHSDGTPYDGTATRGNEKRTACECTEPTINGLLADR